MMPLREYEADAVISRKQRQRKEQKESHLKLREVKKLMIFETAFGKKSAQKQVHNLLEWQLVFESSGRWTLCKSKRWSRKTRYFDLVTATGVKWLPVVTRWSERPGSTCQGMSFH